MNPPGHSFTEAWNTTALLIYMYIYMCVCVCVCVCGKEVDESPRQSNKEALHTITLHIYIYIKNGDEPLGQLITEALHTSTQAKCQLITNRC